MLIESMTVRQRPSACSRGRERACICPEKAKKGLQLVLEVVRGLVYALRRPKKGYGSAVVAIKMPA